MYWLSVLYLQWIHFWRLPETDQSRRTDTPRYSRRVEWLKSMWIIGLSGLTMLGVLPVLMVGVLLMTFLSFMFLDEAEDISE